MPNIARAINMLPVPDQVFGGLHGTMAASGGVRVRSADGQHVFELPLRAARSSKYLADFIDSIFQEVFC